MATPPITAPAAPVTLPAKPTVTSVLEAIFADAIVPALEVAFPVLGTIANIPVVGVLETMAIDDLGNWLISNGVVEIKMGIIDILSDASQAEWANELVILKAIRKGGLSAAQQKDYDDDLQNLVRARKGLVNS